MENDNHHREQNSWQEFKLGEMRQLRRVLDVKHAVLLMERGNSLRKYCTGQGSPGAKEIFETC
jgi:hypothetical protein